MRSWASMSGRLKLALGAMVVVVLVATGVLASQRFHADDAHRAGDAHPTTRPSDVVRPVAKTLALGSDAKVSPNYRVTVTDVSVYEGSTQHVLVANVKVTYIGKDEGDPWADLVAEFDKPHARSLDDSGCPESVRNSDVSDPPAMAPGDTESYAFCFDLPTSKVDGGKVFVEEAFSKGERFPWSTDGATIKQLPSPSPEAPAPQEPASAPRFVPPHASNSHYSHKLNEYRNDLDKAIEKYQKQRDRVDAQITAYKKAGYSDDQLKGYRKWRDKLDNAIEYYKRQRDKLGN